MLRITKYLGKMSEYMLTAVDREVLVCLLLDGANTPSNIADIVGRHPNSVMDSLDRLEDSGYVRDKGGGVHSLTYQGAVTAQTVRREFTVDLSFERSL